MSGKDVFGVVVRTVGLVSALFGAYDVSAALYVALAPENPHRMTPVAAVCYGLLYALAGVLLLRGASQIVAFSYPDVL